MVADHTLMDRKRKCEIRKMCNTQNLVRRARQRRKEWNQHVTQMQSRADYQILLGILSPVQDQRADPQKDE